MKENISNVEYARSDVRFYGNLLDENKREIMDHIMRIICADEIAERTQAQ